MSTITQTPQFAHYQVQELVRRHYNRVARVRSLAGESDQTFYIKSITGPPFIVKIANPATDDHFLALQNEVLRHLQQQAPDLPCPRLCPTVDGKAMVQIKQDGVAYWLRLLSYLPGELWVNAQADDGSYNGRLLTDLGRLLARLDLTLVDLEEHKAVERPFIWHIQQADNTLRRFLPHIDQPDRRTIVRHFLSLYLDQIKPLLPLLPSGLIHHDANDYNILVQEDDQGDFQLSGLLDFGDIIYAPWVYEVAVAAAYMMLDKEEPLRAAAHIVAGYQEHIPFSEAELDLLLPLIGLRLCLSVTISAYQQKLRPDDPYLTVSERPAWRLLEKLVSYDPQQAGQVLAGGGGRSLAEVRAQADGRSKEALLSSRQQYLSPSLSLAYQEPLQIVRGFGQYLFAQDGRRYLDCVNNVAHVGHSHPHLFRVARRQMATLNTNTRYLHEHIVAYAERLTATMPDPLSCCFFVCSGSEANELALRLARTHTGRRDLLVLDGAYHGNTSTLVASSPYKFKGPGGQGAAESVHVAPLPDRYRGPYRYEDEEAGAKYAAALGRLVAELEANGRHPAAFIAESLPGCAGQIVLPPGYLAEAYRLVRAAGGLCIADEVQVGFGRVGSHFWGFETQEVIPDIVTLGKPIGNGHPLAAVVTTPEIAASFANGMEYFNTFGGNPVSCAIGLGVLDVIEEEGLADHARQVGDYLLEQLQTVAAEYPLLGDVRGLGFFLGLELVRDRQTLEPAAEEATAIVEMLKEAGILLSVDGLHHNVLKFKPPLLFSQENAEQLVAELQRALSALRSGN